MELLDNGRGLLSIFLPKGIHNEQGSIIHHVIKSGGGRTYATFFGIQFVTARRRALSLITTYNTRVKKRKKKYFFQLKKKLQVEF